MATLQAFCNICQKKVSAHTVLGDEETLGALERGEDVRIKHVTTLPDGTSAEHCWSLSAEERARLLRQMTGAR